MKLLYIYSSPFAVAYASCELPHPTVEGWQVAHQPRAALRA